MKLSLIDRLLSLLLGVPDPTRSNYRASFDEQRWRPGDPDPEQEWRRDE